MSDPKVESFIFEDYEEAFYTRGEKMKVSDQEDNASGPEEGGDLVPTFLGEITGAQVWIGDVVHEAVRKAIADGVCDAPLFGRWGSRAALGEQGPEMILPLRRQDDSRLLAAQAAPHPTPPVTKAVLFDGYPLRHVVGYSLLEQWVEVLVFDGGGERPIWRDGKWLTQRLNGKVESIADGKKT